MKPDVQKLVGLSVPASHKGMPELLKVSYGLYIVGAIIISLLLMFFDVRYREQSGELSGLSSSTAIGPRTALRAILEQYV